MKFSSVFARLSSISSDFFVRISFSDIAFSSLNKMVYVLNILYFS
jgi:hypothetical protein